MIGEARVRVLESASYTIHGDLYYRLLVVPADDAEGAPSTIAVPRHAVAEQPVAGQALAVSFLMGQVTGARAI